MIGERLATTLILNTLFALVAIAVGRHLLQRRPQEPHARRALTMFSVWWLGFGADTLINALTWLAGGLGIASEPVTAVLTYAALVSIVLMTWGLTYYLVYLISGRADLFTPIATFYAFSLGGMLALIVYLRPTGVAMGAWAGSITYATKPPAIAELLVAIYFLLPPILGSVAYAVVGLRARVDPARRYRILAVATGILVWFLASLLFTATPGAGNEDARAIAGRVIGAACMMLIVSAYVQPGSFRRWLARGRADRAASRAALAERARELI